MDAFFGQEDNNISQIFHKEVNPLIPGILEGRNVTIFAYGATGSGKTYTMQVCFIFCVTHTCSITSASEIDAKYTRGVGDIYIVISCNKQTQCFFSSLLLLYRFCSIDLRLSKGHITFRIETMHMLIPYMQPFGPNLELFHLTSSEMCI